MAFLCDNIHANMLLSVRYHLRPEAESTLSAIANSTRPNPSPPAAPPTSAFQTGHQSAAKARKENLVPSSSSRTSPLSHKISRQKSAIHIGGNSIPVPPPQDQQVHRVTFDHSPRSEKNCSATFPRRSFIPVPKTPEKARSHLSIPITPTSTKSIRIQLPGDTPKSNLSSLFDQLHRAPADPASPKSSTPTSTKFKAPLLQTQVRAEERQRLRLRLEEMGRRNGGKGIKKPRPSNIVDNVEASSLVTATTAPVVEESEGSGGAVQAPSTVVDSVEPQVILEPAVTATIIPPETFAVPHIPSAISSPTTFYSAFGSPVSDSTTSGIFEDAMTGNELLSTDKIQEPMLDSVPKDDSSPGTDAAPQPGGAGSNNSKSSQSSAVQVIETEEDPAGK